MNSPNDNTLNKQTKALVHTTFAQREEERYHHSYDEELLQYEYVRNGDMRSIDESKRLFRSNITGILSSNELRNKKYLFVASITLATRFCIEGGMDAQTAYNSSDLYIQQADLCQTVDEVNKLHTIMISDFTARMASLHAQNKVFVSKTDTFVSNKSDLLSKPIAECLDYIYYHLHQKITLQELADTVSLTPNYLASLFKKEKGITIQKYIRTKRMEAAKNMLLYSEYSLTEIGEFLAFSSSSHFIKIFREETGMTPKEFQKANFRRHHRWAD
ncbi:MAG: helix-turn-helix domain-containing protein [bacterium]|nr:helix-turn-helix domain-containing protein [bacterium]